MSEPTTHLQLLAENMDTAVILLDEAFAVSFLNASAEMLLEKSLARVRGRRIAEVCPNQTDVLEIVYSAAANATRVSRRELSVRLPSGREIIINLTCTPIQGGGVLIEIQQIARLLNISQDEIRQREYAALRQLVRGLAHEVKNPLGGIRGAAQLLESELEWPELKEYTQVIISETDRLQTLIDRMLGPRRPPVKGRVNVHEITEHVRRLLAAEAGPNIRLERDYDPSIPELMVDRDQLVQAVLNVARNSLEAVGPQPGVITLRTRIARQYTIDGVRHPLVVRIQIHDTGPGISEDMQSRVFFPMVTDKANGTGLGLSIAQSLVNAHGGILKFHSQPHDTTFEIILPLDNTP